MSDRTMSRNGRKTAAFAGLLALLLASLFFVGASMAAGPNAVDNGDFESGGNGWLCKRCSLNVGAPAVEGSAAGHFQTTHNTSRGQVFYKNITLEPNTEYTLSFQGMSPGGRTVRAYVEQQVKPRANYGLKNYDFELTSNWQSYSVTFTTKNFNKTTDDARLRLRFDRGKNHEYSLDNIVLTADGAPPPPQATATPKPPGATATPPPQATSTPKPPPPGNGKSQLIFHFDDVITASAYSGFIMDKTDKYNDQDWSQYEGGLFYFRAHIKDIPVNQPGMKLGWCFWQNGNTLENCKGNKVPGVPGTVAKWTVDPDKMWMKNGKPIDYSQPRTKMGFVIRDAQNDPVSLKTSNNWGGNDPDDWYPMRVDYEVWYVGPGGNPPGWW